MNSRKPANRFPTEEDVYNDTYKALNEMVKAFIRCSEQWLG